MDGKYKPFNVKKMQKNKAKIFIANNIGPQFVIKIEPFHHSISTPTINVTIVITYDIQLATNQEYTPTKLKWVTDENGNQRKVEVAKRVKPWWTASADGKLNLVVRYGSKPLEFSKGKNAIEIASEANVADVLLKVKEAVTLGEFDALIEKQAQFGRRVTQKNK